MIRRGLLGLSGAALASQPEEADAGLLNVAARALREGSAIARRSEADERGIGRGERNVQARVQLNAKEKAAIRKSIKGKKIKEVDAFNVARDFKKRHPKGEWEQPEITGIEQNDKGQLKLLTKQVPYKFNKTKQDKVIKPGSKEFQRISDNLVAEILEIQQRAAQGDPSALKIMDNVGWYKNVESRLRSEYGSFSQMMADILGATSPNTPVATNFKFSKEILDRATRGDFDDLMDGFADALDRRYALQDQAAAYLKAQKAAGRTIKAAEKDPAYLALMDEAKEISRELQANRNTIKQADVDPKTGQPKNFGINSYNGMVALADRWRVLRVGGAPKAKNFSGNLSGRSEQATIDVWSARNLRRHAGRKPIPSSAEGTVSGNIVDAENFRNSLEFGFGQQVVADATAKINAATGLGLEPRDVQALQWFAEKDHWTKRGWTSRQGEGGSFETMMDGAGREDPVESLFLGQSRDQDVTVPGQDVTFTPTPDEGKRTAQEIVAAGKADPDIKARKGLPTIGRFAEYPETAMDIDIVSREDMLPVEVLDAATRQAVKDKQESFFIARRQDRLGQEYPGLFNVGTEFYFKDPVTAESPLIGKIHDRLTDSGLLQYTLVVDPRDANSVIGMRVIDIPQYHSPEKFARMSQPEYDKYVDEQFANYDQIGEALRSEFPEISNAMPSYFDVNVKSRGAAEKYVEQLEAPEVDLDAQRQAFYGWEPAIQRFQEFDRKTTVADQGSGGSAGPTQKGSIDPRLAATLAPVGLLGAGASEPTTREKAAGLLDAAANIGAAAIAPIANAPITLLHALTTDRPTSDVRTGQQQRLEQMDYQPRTELGQQYTEDLANFVGEQINQSNILDAIGNMYGQSRILQIPQRAYQQLPDRARLVASSLFDAIPL